MLKILLKKKNMSIYQLERSSSISHATLLDICNEKTNVEKCSCLLLSNLSNALNIPMNKLYDYLSYKDLSLFAYNDEFDLFKSNICHELKEEKYIYFLKKYLNNNLVKELYDKKKTLEAIYLVAMIDFLCKSHNLPVPKEYESIRKLKSQKVIVPKSIFLLLVNKKIRINDILKECNPVFYKHNLIESEIYNVI